MKCEWHFSIGADRTSAAINVNLPVGSQIFVASDSSLWEVILPINGAGTAVSINTVYLTATPKLTKINKGGTYKVEEFDEPASPTGTVTLAHMPLGGITGVHVSLNGSALKPTTDFTIAGTTITIVSPDYGYDRIIVAYTY